MRSSLALLFLTLCSSPFLWAQSYFGGIRGQVTDSAGGAVATVKVTITDTSTNVSRSTLTNEAGEYVFSSVPPATYVITAEAPGFKRLERPGVLVATQQFLTIDLKLELGQVTESVMVTEEIPLMETSNASTGQVIDRQKLVDLPNLGRNPFMMAKIAPNVVQVGDPRFNRMQDQSGSSQISIAGGPVRGNNYLLDGIPITDANNRAIIIPTIEAVGEVKIQANTYDAEMGRTGGGVFNAYLKSGSNEIHGSAFGYMRQGSWLANDFFNNRNGVPRPNTPFRNYGASFGGPIWIPKLYQGRNRSFFWLAGEAYRQKSAVSQEFALPTQAERSGDFSSSRTRSGAPQTIFDPLTTRLVDGVWVRDPFAGNILPANRIHPVGRAIASYFPIPSRSASFHGAPNYLANSILGDRADQVTVKVDHEFFTWWRANFSYLHYGSREPGENWFGTLSTPTGWLLYRKVDATQWNNSFTPNPTTVINVRYGFNRFPNDTRTVADGFNPANLGLPASYVSQLQYLRFPSIVMQNFSNLADSNGAWEMFHSRNLLGSMAKYIGKHSLKAGADYRVINLDFLPLTNISGRFVFNDQFTRRDALRGGDGTGSDLASLLLGHPAGGDVRQFTKLLTFIRYYAGYFHDDWRITPKLTLNLGLRYEWETGLAERQNRLVVGFDRNVVSPLAANVTGLLPRGGVMYAGMNGNPTTCCNPNRNKLSPRFGVAWAMSPKTTIRGGYGLFWAPVRYESNTDIALGYLVSTELVGSNDGGLTPATSLSNPFPSGVLKPVGNALGLLAGVGQSFGFFDQARRSPYVHQYSFDIQRELPGRIALSVGYVGSLSRQLPPSGTSLGGFNINQLEPRLFDLGVNALSQAIDNPLAGRGGTGVVGAARVSRAQLLRPFPQFGTVRAFTSLARARYDSLVLKLDKRLTSGLSFTANYTLSKNYDSSFATGSTLNAQGGFPQNAYDLQAEYSLSTVHTPHRLTGSFTYELPFGKGRKFVSSSQVLDIVAGGWAFNGVFMYQTGFPLAITQNQNLNSVAGAELQRPNATGVSPVVAGELSSKLDNYLSPAAFSQAAALTFGNLSRTITYLGPGTANWDLSVFKTFTVYEKWKAQFRAEALNAFNTPLFRGPNTAFGNASFGRITRQANFPRYIQLGVRFFF
ncbi:MAG: TonB-dependent receptor [Bryobacteraceae bacterium]|nr:TonB-dependent receptor [Bryobacteraceae bacterium]MDW8378144.1 TonB-dependent receptor [Bryobacterales bacterium]